MRFSAVIFDMDGVIIDSELYWIKAETSFLQKYNIQLTKEHVLQATGRSLRESVAMLKEQFNLAPSVDNLLGEKNKCSEEIYAYQAQAMPGVVELITKAKESDAKIAIASGSSLERIEKIVNLLGWRKYFDELVSTDHVNFVGKPDPAIYKYTAKVLKVAPESCIVLEDSVNGVRAAKAAGMSCVAVPDLRWSYGDFSGADLVVDSLVDPRLLKFMGDEIGIKK